MSTIVVLAVLLSALLHASWNALVKGGNDRWLTSGMIGGFGGMGAPGGGYEQRLLELRARHVDCLRALLPEALWAPLEA